MAHIKCEPVDDNKQITDYPEVKQEAIEIDDSSIWALKEERNCSSQEIYIVPVKTEPVDSSSENLNVCGVVIKKEDFDEGESGNELEKPFFVTVKEDLHEETLTNEEMFGSSDKARAKVRRMPLRGSRKRSIVHMPDSSDDDKNAKGKGQRGKRSRGQKMKAMKPAPKTSSQKSAATPSSVPAQPEAIPPAENPVVGTEFSSGAFLVMKTDLATEEYPLIWKINGKSLLQKYTPLEIDGRIYYTHSSNYRGWSIFYKDLYYPAPITIKCLNRKDTVVEFFKNEIPL